MEKKLTYILWMIKQKSCGNVEKYYVSITSC